jgi:hypothetical protein
VGRTCDLRRREVNGRVEKLLSVRVRFAYLLLVHRAVAIIMYC